MRRSGSRLFILVFLILAGCRVTKMNQQATPDSTASAARNPDSADVFHEASMNFDAANVRPFLQRLSARFPEFGAQDVDRLSEGISKIPVDSERAWVLTIQQDGESVPLRVRVLMDDVDSPDLYFYSVPGVVGVIDRELKAFANEKGL